jgi:hypothetical protein
MIKNVEYDTLVSFYAALSNLTMNELFFSFSESFKKEVEITLRNIEMRLINIKKESE